MGLLFLFATFERLGYANENLRFLMCAMQLKIALGFMVLSQVYPLPMGIPGPTHHYTVGCGIMVCTAAFGMYMGKKPMSMPKLPAALTPMKSPKTAMSKMGAKKTMGKKK